MKTISYITISILFALVGISIASCSGSEEQSSGDIRSTLQQYKWECKTSDDPLVDDDYQWVILDDYVITLYFVSDYECVIRYFRKHYDSDDGTSYERDAQTVRYTTQGSKVVLETSAYTELEFMFNGESLIGKNSVHTREAISSSDREWIDENFVHIKSDQEVADDNKIKKMISENITVSGTYSDYVWHFEITSTLHNVIKDKNIEFGVGHGDVNGNTPVTLGNQANTDDDPAAKYTYRKSGDKVIAAFDIPFWYYYIWGIPVSDDDAFTKAAMFYTAYKNMKAAGSNSWTKEERQLYNDLVKYLNEYERGAVRYHPSVQVRIGNKYYMVKEF
ncbi:MAG: hypothetical protein IJY03_04210 [Prevotella sp.]|nr:hypothetical protein [Prevotella sp.]